MENNNSTPAPVPSSASQTLNPPTPAPQTEMQPLSGGVFLSTEQQHALAQDAIKRGDLTHESANQLLASHGEPPLASPTAEGFKTPTEAAMDHYKPAQGHEYSIPYTAPQSDEHADYMQRRNEHVRAWLTAAELPKLSGDAIMQTFESETAKISGFQNKEQYKAWIDSESQMLRRVWKNDFDKNIAEVQALSAQIEAKHPGYTQYLHATGVTYSAQFIVQLHNHAQRLAAKKGLGPNS